MRALAAAAAVLLLGSCYDPDGQCAADDECLSEQVCGVDGLCVPGTRPPPGTPPTAGADAYDFLGGGPFDVAADVGVLADDLTLNPGGGTLTAQLVAGPSHGAVYLAPDGGFTYAPTLGYVGTDAFTYRATNGVLSSGETTVSITVSPGPPTARADAFVAAQDVPLAVAAAGVLANDSSDPGGRTLTASLVTGPANGLLVLAPDGGFTYTPNAGYVGADAFTYRAVDASIGTLQSAETTVTLTVAP